MLSPCKAVLVQLNVRRLAPTSVIDIDGRYIMCFGRDDPFVERIVNGISLETDDRLFTVCAGLRAGAPRAVERKTKYSS